MGLWTIEHLLTIIPTFIVFTIISLLLRKLLINKSYEIRMIPLKIIGIVLIVIEICKQITSFNNGYNLYHIPLHFCSLFLFLIPLIAFYRGKYHEAVRSLGTSLMLVLFIGMLIMPEVIYKSNRIRDFFSDYISFHTVFFHNLVILAFFLMISLNLHNITNFNSNQKFVLISGIIFSLVAATMSHLLQTNFSNFLNTTVGPLENLIHLIENSLGKTIFSILYSTIISLLHILVFVLSNYVMSKIFGKLKNLTND